jgi:2-polyprenyl-6-methoxyphenol hydroxylase-like FAD-dependent oxidoreductase
MRAKHFGQQAVVIGASMAGLMTARVLADYFDQVTVLDRDDIDDKPKVHKSTPQGHHLHVLLLGGQQVLSSLYPGFLERLSSLGAVRYRAGKEIVWFRPDGKTYSPTSTVREPRDLGFDGYCQSRGLLEYCVRQCTAALPNVRFITGSTVQGLLYENGRVQGVRYATPDGSRQFSADVVVDAGGRGSHAPRWLAELGFQTPVETTIGVDFAYTSTKFRIPDTYDEPERLQLFFGPPPHFPSGGIMEEIEDHTWHVSLAGRFGNFPPADEAGFLAFARSLHTPRLYELIKDAERVVDIVSYRFPTSVLRHYERLATFPEGFLVLGDAICSFNPIYGQGMSSAALQVNALRHILMERSFSGRGTEGLASAFFPQAANIIFTPWTLAANQDLAYPQTKGERPANLAEGAQYFAAVGALAADDIEVHKLVAEVFNLAKPLSALREEPLQSRVREQVKKSTMSPAH